MHTTALSSLNGGFELERGLQINTHQISTLYDILETEGMNTSCKVTYALESVYSVMEKRQSMRGHKLRLLYTVKHNLWKSIGGKTLVQNFLQKIQAGVLPPIDYYLVRLTVTKQAKLVLSPSTKRVASYYVRIFLAIGTITAVLAIQHDSMIPTAVGSTTRQ